MSQLNSETTDMPGEMFCFVTVLRWSGDPPRFTTRQVLGVDALHAALEVQQRCDRLLQTFSVILVFTAFLKLL